MTPLAKRRWRAAAGLVVVAAVAAAPLACGRDEAGASGAGAREGEARGEAVVGPLGGTVVAGDVTLDVPAGALASSVTIAIDVASSTVPSPWRGLSPVYRFTPEALTFALPATVRIASASASASAATVVWSRVDGSGYDPIATRYAEGVAAAEVTHLGEGFAVEADRQDAGDDRDAASDVARRDDASLGDGASGDSDGGGGGDAGFVDPTLQGCPQPDAGSDAEVTVFGVITRTWDAAASPYADVFVRVDRTVYQQGTFAGQTSTVANTTLATPGSLWCYAFTVSAGGLEDPASWSDGGPASTGVREVDFQLTVGPSSGLTSQGTITVQCSPYAPFLYARPGPLPSPWRCDAVVPPPP